VVSAEEIVASIPSYFIDPERACPATTYYRSVQVHGTLEAVEDPEPKARVLQALMAKYQAEGGHVPVEAGHPLYERAVRGVLVVRVRPERVDGKAKLGQNRRPEELVRVIEALWARGHPGDAAAVDLVREANPGVPPPSFLEAPPGARLVCACGPADLEGAVLLVEAEYWNEGRARETVARAFLGSAAWVGAKDDTGALVATARAVGDGAKVAWVYDVAVRRDWRGRGLGPAVLRLLLDHPAVRRAELVRLRTRDAHGLYRHFGFVDAADLPPLPFPSTEMALARGLVTASAP
jgi:ribosomal protein S18 acetylase RimI-like enzyme